jgi:predicted nucleic acid-binding protein
MILLDTDTVTLAVAGHKQLRERIEQADDTIAVTIITRIEILQGRFDYLRKAADGAQLQQAMERLQRSENDLQAFAVVPVS